MFLDQEKCFDRVDHGFMFKTLEAFGFGPGFLGLVRSFYNGATSRVLVNGVFSEKVSLGRGVRQGDSPSSQLYVLTAEVMANSVRKDEQIRGIKIRGREKKIGGYADDTQGFLTSDASIVNFLSQVSLFERASGSKLNRAKTEGLWLGPWRDRTGSYHGLNWKDRVKVLGVWIGRGDLVGANFDEVYARIRSRLTAWKGRPLSALGKAKVANVFLYSPLWYRTELYDPVRQGRGGAPGYGALEAEVGSWLFWGRQEVGKDRLRDPYSKGGAQLVDIRDKVRTQRVLWLKRLLAMPLDAFPRVLADELIGSQFGGYYGVDSLKGLEGGLRIRARGFYKGAIEAWSVLNLKFFPGNNPIDNYNLFFNPYLTDETGAPFKWKRPLPGGNISTVGDLKAATRLTGRVSQGVKNIIKRCLKFIPNAIAGADKPDFVLEMEDNSTLKLAKASFKDVYSQFRAKARVDRHFMAKWEKALNVSLEGEWKGIWDALHHSGASYRVRSAVQRQVGLNFWTCYMDAAYIARGDGACEMCGVQARERWHTVLDCPVVVGLWGKLSATLVGLDYRVVTRQERGLGLSGKGEKVRLRNRLGYTLRSVILGMRWVRVREVDRAVSNIWTAFLVQLKRELVEDYWVARFGGSLVDFSRSVLVDGVLGRMDGVRVEWGPLLQNVCFGYWDLFY